MAATSGAKSSDAMAAEPEAGADAWMYCVEGAQRGPLPGHALLKLLERGVVPMTCLVWRPEQEGWQAPSEAAGLKARAALVRCQFFVADAAAAEGRVGPFPLAELRRRFDDGAVDGLSAVFVGGGDAWRPVGEVPGLRSLLVTEEAALENDAADQVFVPEAQPEEEPARGAAKPSKKRSFRGDDGTRYVCTDAGDWVEAEDQGESSDDDEEAAEAAQFAEDDGAAAAEKEERAAERRAKREKKKAKKKQGGWDKNASKCWIYVEGLPADVTPEELCDHFGKCGVIAADPESNAPKVKIYRAGKG